MRKQLFISTLAFMSLTLFADEVCEISPNQVVTSLELEEIAENCTMKNNPFGIELFRSNSNRLLYPVEVSDGLFELEEFTL